MATDNWLSDVDTALQIAQTLSFANPEAAAFFGVADEVVNLLFGSDSNILTPILTAIQNLQTNLESYFSNLTQDEAVQSLLQQLNTVATWYQTAITELNGLQDPTSAVNAIINSDSGYLAVLSQMGTPSPGTLYTVIQTLLTDPDFQPGAVYGVDQYTRVQIKFVALLAAVSLLLSSYKTTMSMQQFVQQNTNLETSTTYGPALDDTVSAASLSTASLTYGPQLTAAWAPEPPALYAAILSRRLAAIGTFGSAGTVNLTAPLVFSAKNDDSERPDPFCGLYGSTGMGWYSFYNQNRAASYPCPFAVPSPPDDLVSALLQEAAGANGFTFQGYAVPDPLADPDPQQIWVVPLDISLTMYGPDYAVQSDQAQLSDAQTTSYTSFATTNTEAKFAPAMSGQSVTEIWNNSLSALSTTPPAPPATPVTISSWDTTASNPQGAWAVESVMVRYAIYWARQASPMGTAAKIWSDWSAVSGQNPTLSGLPTTPAVTGDVLWVLRQFGVPSSPGNDPDAHATPVRPIVSYPDSSGTYPATYTDTAAAVSTLATG